MSPTTKPLVAIVTGATGGIGRSTTERLASRGIWVLLADRNSKAAQSLAVDMAARHKVRAEFLEIDITQEEQVKTMVQEAASWTGRVDYAANCAGGLFEMPGGRTDQTTLHVLQSTLAVNVEGLWLCQKYQAEQMTIQPPRHLSWVSSMCQGQFSAGERGAVANVISVAGLQAVGLSAYTTSKHAGIGLTREAAVAYGRHGIRVNALCPGLVETPMSDGFVNHSNRAPHSAAFALGRASHPAEQANVISFLLSDESSYMTGACITNDGGYTDLKLPTYMDVSDAGEGQKK